MSLTSSNPSITDGWLHYPVHAFPHHTDYAGIVWHGTYVNWMEEARVEWLRLAGLHYQDFVAAGCDLPVAELSLRYHQSIQMGMDVVLHCRLLPSTGVRIIWEYMFKSTDGQQHYASGTVTLVPINKSSGKIMRRLPPKLQQIIRDVENSQGQ